MLWWKAWSESRVRFFLTGLTLSIFCVSVVALQPYVQHHPLPIPLSLRRGATTEYLYNLIFAGTGKGMFALLVIFLGLGGLQRERAQHTAGFTLALPVSRLQVIETQMAVGVMELAALAAIPALVVSGISSLLHRSYPPAMALHFSVLWFFGGLVLFAVSFLLSVVFAGEYTAPVVCYLVLVVHALVSAWHPLAPYRLNLMWMMGEFRTMHWNAAHTLLQPPPLSWLRMAALAALACALLAASARVTRRQDF